MSNLKYLERFEQVLDLAMMTPKPHTRKNENSADAAGAHLELRAISPLLKIQNTSAGGDFVRQSADDKRVRADLVGRAHFMMYGNWPDESGRDYWQMQLSQCGGVSELLVKMAAGRNYGSIELGALWPTTARLLRDRTVRLPHSPIAQIWQAFNRLAKRDPSFSEIEQLLQKSIDLNAGPLDIRHSLAAGSTSSSPLQELGIFMLLIKALSAIGRRIFGTRFNLAPFDRAYLLADMIAVETARMLFSLSVDVRGLQRNYLERESEGA